LQIQVARKRGVIVPGDVDRRRQRRIGQHREILPRSAQRAAVPGRLGDTSFGYGS
jgi:hypothetical protein